MREPKDLPTQERLRELLSYDPDTGLFRWIVHRSSTARIGSIAGKIVFDAKKEDARLKIQVDGEWYYAHRLAFVFMTGTCPLLVDHEDGDGLDNRWRKIRAATPHQNTRNAKRRRDNSSGVKNVYWIAQGRCWQVNIQAGAVRYRRNFRSLSDADKFADEFRIKLHGDFARAA